jgi:hypothetical protein
MDKNDREKLDFVYWQERARTFGAIVGLAVFVLFLIVQCTDPHSGHFG